MRGAPTNRNDRGKPQQILTLVDAFFGQVFGDQFGQTEQRDFHFIRLDAVLHHHATIRAGRDDGVDLEFLDLGFLFIERSQLQLLGTLVTADAATAAAAPVHAAVIGHLDKVLGDRLEQISGLRHDATAANN